MDPNPHGLCTLILMNSYGLYYLIVLYCNNYSHGVKRVMVRGHGLKTGSPYSMYTNRVKVIMEPGSNGFQYHLFQYPLVQIQCGHSGEWLAGCMDVSMCLVTMKPTVS